MQSNIKRGATSLAVKAGAWYVLSTFMSKALAFITTPLFSRMMSRNDYGEFMNFASWFTTLFIVTSLEMFNTAPRAYYDYKDEYDKYTSSITIASILVSCGFLIAALFCRNWLYEVFSIPPQYVPILFIALMVQAGKQVFLARERTLYRYKAVAALTFVNLLVPTLTAVLLVWNLPSEAQLSGRIYGTYIPIAIIDLFCTIYLVKRGKTFNLGHVKYALKLSLPLLLHYFTAYLLTSTNVIITRSVLDASTTAVVSISTSVISILTVLSESLTGAVTTWLMDNIEQDNRKKIYRDLSFYMIGLVTLAVGIILLTPEVVWVLGGSKYGDAVQIIPLLVVSVMIQTITSIFVVVLTYEKRIVKTAIFNAVGAVSSIIAKIVLLPVFGITALPIINIVVFLFLFIINYIMIYQLGYRDVINIKVAAVLILFALCLGLLSPVIYANLILRITIIIIIICGILTLLIKNRKKS